MFSSVFFGLGFTFLYGSNLILHRIQKDYADYGVLRNSTTFLQVLLLAIHLLFYLLSFKTPQWPLGWPDLTGSSWICVAGLLLVITGVAVLYSALKMFPALDRFLGCRVTVLEKGGIYRWSRNPQIVGYGLILLGVTFLWYTDYTLIATILYAPIAHRLVLIEEEHLRRIFKDKFISYCEETDRYFGKKPLMTKLTDEKYSMGNT